MNNNRVTEVEGINDKYNPLPLSISYQVGEGGECSTVLMREETHTIGNPVKHQMLRMPEVNSVGCGMLHPHDIKIMQLQVRAAPGAPPTDELLLRALGAVRDEARQLLERWREAAAGAAGST